MNWYKTAQGTKLLEHTNVCFFLSEGTGTYMSDGILKFDENPEKGYYDIEIETGNLLRVSVWTASNFSYMTADLNLSWHNAHLDLKLVREVKGTGKNLWRGETAIPLMPEWTLKGTTNLLVEPWPELKITGNVGLSELPAPKILRRKWKPWK